MALYAVYRPSYVIIIVGCDNATAKRWRCRFRTWSNFYLRLEVHWLVKIANPSYSFVGTMHNCIFSVSIHEQRSFTAPILTRVSTTNAIDGYYCLNCREQSKLYNSQFLVHVSREHLSCHGFTFLEIRCVL